MNVDIILISGSSYKSGKDTAADMIAEAILNGQGGEEPVIYREMFARSIKQTASIFTGMQMKFIHKDTYWNSKHYDFTQEQKDTYLDLYEMTLGEMLQKMATEALRDNFDKDIHVKSVAMRIKQAIDTWSEMRDRFVFIIPDWRFPNELNIGQYLEGIEGTIHKLKVVRDVDKQELQGRDINHASETSLDSYEHMTMLMNNGTLDDLRTTCEAYVKQRF